MERKRQEAVQRRQEEERRKHLAAKGRIITKVSFDL
jgi:hypothetical protein